MSQHEEGQEEAQQHTEAQDEAEAQDDQPQEESSPPPPPPRECICSFNGLPTTPPTRPCGYCKGTRPGLRINIGAHFYFLTPAQYEVLFNRQWRRCGKYYYQPQNHDSCCPQYAIRLDATATREKNVEKRSHKRVRRIVQHWLRTGERHLPRKKISSSPTGRGRPRRCKKQKSFYDRLLRENFSELNEYLFQVVSDHVLPTLEVSFPREMDRHSPVLSSICSVRFNFQSISNPERGQLLLDIALGLSGRIRSFAAQKKKRDPTAEDVFVCPARKIAALIVSGIRWGKSEWERLGIRKIEALRSGHVEIWLTDEKDARCRLDQFITEGVEPEIPIQEEEEGEEEETSATTTTQASASASARDEQPDPSESEVDLENEIIVIKTNGECTDEEFELYRKYQIRIHGDTDEEVTRERYTHVQCDTTLQSVIDPNLPMGGYGSFHLQYRVKKTDQLLAVSVIDILPHVFCSVYFFWDPDYRFLCLGVWSCLHEIEMVREASLTHPEFKYYDLGYYVHTCPKMNYKAQFSPQELLCNETWKWIDLDVCRTVLDVVDYGRFAPEGEESEDAAAGDEYDFSNQMVFYQGMALPFTNFVEVLKPEVIEKFLLFRHSVGSLASEVLFYLRDDDVIL